MNCYRYYKSNRLSEKSDVYSFGIVLLEIITGRSVMSKRLGDIRLSDWVTSMLEKGLIDDIIDPILKGNFNVNAAWKFVEISIKCVSPISAQRPNMDQVLGELKVCLEMTKIPAARGKDLRNSDAMDIAFSFNAEDITQPSAR